MNVGFVKSIAALLMGTGFALAQSPAVPGSKSPAVPGSKMTPRGTLVAAPRTDVSYPASAGQQPYTEPIVSEANGNIGVVEGGFGGTVYGEYGEDSYTFFGSTEFLMWNIRNPSLPPLTTILPVGLVRFQQPVSIDGIQDVTAPIFSIPFTLNNNPGLPNGSSVDMGEHNGTRLTIGAWCDPDKDLGIELSGFALEKLTENFTSSTANVTNQFNLDTGVQQLNFTTIVTADTVATELLSSAPVVIPAQGTSNVFGFISSELWGSEINLRSGGYRLGCATFGGLCGVRHVNFEEEVLVANSVSVTAVPVTDPQVDPNLVLPITYKSIDNLRTRNRIFAPQIGLDAEMRGYGCFVSARAKVGVGPNYQEVEAFGQFSSTSPSATFTNRSGGLFTGPNNQGKYERTRVAVIPEINLKLGCEICHALRAYVGYDALYMQHVVRPGQQVSFTNITTQLQVANSSTTLGVRQPVIIMRDLDTWVQGLNFGLELRV